MFCKYCGKQIIENSKFCQYCGNSLSYIETNGGNNGDNSLISSHKTVKKSEINQFSVLLSLTFLVFSFIVRFTMQELVTIRYFLAFDDCYVLTDTGRVLIIIFMAIQVLGLFYLRVLGINKNKPIKVSAYILLVVALIVEILLIIVRFPAPY
ncbi:MAG: zinc-ribbon domain-containing protein [Clostridia bacterium]|nr:zinc-ribbon domain-containing protein [Clostridia bacterium]